jgi:hypothetical protein
MNDLKPDCENVELPIEIPEFEDIGPTFYDEDEEIEDETRQYELIAKVNASMRRFEILLRIPFVRTRFFHFGTRPFFEGWDDRVVEVVECPLDDGFEHDPTQHR